MLTLGNLLRIRLKAAFLRITLTKYMTGFFLFSFFFCFAQGILQSFLFSIDSHYSSFIFDVLSKANAPVHTEIAYLTRPHGTFILQLCSHVPHEGNNFPCETIIMTGSNSSQRIETDAGTTSRRSLVHHNFRDVMSVGEDTVSVQPFRNASGEIAGVTLSRNGQTPVFLNEQCTKVLIYPAEILMNMQREAIALIAAQFWLFGVSFIAIMYESVPHTLAVFCARIIATGWSAYVLWRTGDIKNRFYNLVTQPNSPCHVELFSDYFGSHRMFEIADFVLNATALMLSAFLSYHLLKAFNAQVFRRAGPPSHIVRIYRYFLTVHVTIQLSVFFLLTAVALWVDQLSNGAIAQISSHTQIYKALFISTLCLLVPWMVMGYFAVRREIKGLMTGFLILGFIFLFFWSIMQYSKVYRFTFEQWPFFACITLTSFINIIVSMIFGVLSWLNFGKGLSSYLNIEYDLEKLDFEHDIFPVKELDKSTGENEDVISYPTVAYSLPTLQSDQLKEKPKGLMPNVFSNKT